MVVLQDSESFGDLVSGLALKLSGHTGEIIELSSFPTDS